MLDIQVKDVSGLVSDGNMYTKDFFLQKHILQQMHITQLEESPIWEPWM